MFVSSVTPLVSVILSMAASPNGKSPTLGALPAHGRAETAVIATRRGDARTWTAAREWTREWREASRASSRACQEAPWQIRVIAETDIVLIAPPIFRG